ncbi:MAG: UDP-N-acetylglucosamine 2-epimerase (non-hydrolyzing) [Acetobacteraceae bacterium]|nr:UDP-N-acetylglucosamine 2-epimerase (non-hydrolyzing) [Acetobacteraceae bacterium]
MLVLSVVGARPQLVKAGPVSAALKAEGIAERLVHTGQHFDTAMSAAFEAEFGLSPAVNLGIHGGTHAEMTARMLVALEAEIAAARPAVVLVYGDTNSTLAGALAAAKLRIPIAHVEAGLRSFNRAMPEEINRIVTDHLSDLLLAPTRTAMAQLAREGRGEAAHLVGDVMFDAALAAARRAEAESDVLGRLGLARGLYAVATLHRAENTDDAGALARAVGFLGERARTLPVVWPVHPRARAALARSSLDCGALTMIEPLAYLDMTQLVRNAALVMTDSGGLQKEAYFHRVPCITLRTETEWPETIEAGWNRLWSEPAWRTPRREIDEYGDGHAAPRIAALLRQSFAAPSPAQPRPTARRAAAARTRR